MRPSSVIYSHLALLWNFHTNLSEHCAELRLAFVYISARLAREPPGRRSAVQNLFPFSV